MSPCPCGCGPLPVGRPRAADDGEGSGFEHAAPLQLQTVCLWCGADLTGGPHECPSYQACDEALENGYYAGVKECCEALETLAAKFAPLGHGAMTADVLRALAASWRTTLAAGCGVRHG